MKKKIIAGVCAVGAVAAISTVLLTGGDGGKPVEAKAPERIATQSGLFDGFVCVYRDGNFQGPYYQGGVGAPSLATGPYCFGDSAGEEEPDLAVSERNEKRQNLNNGISSIVNYGGFDYCAFTGTKAEFKPAGDITNPAFDSRNGVLRIPAGTSWGYVGDEFNDAISSIIRC
ncbi:hypothetical protein [Streptomyces globisporus]|uniref:hypothetical protein n=1 Tax=Streptomyces globisporus TaxID=1908 RepID=UPI00380D8003